MQPGSRFWTLATICATAALPACSSTSVNSNDPGSGGGGGGGGAAAWCGAGSVAQLMDDFEASVLDVALWEPTAGALGEVKVGPALNLVVHLGPDTSGERRATVTSRNVYRFANCELYVQAPQVPTAPNAEVVFGVTPGPAGKVELQYRAGSMVLHREDSNTGSSDSPTIPYVASSHMWWRLREQDATVHFDASPDGATWTPVASVSHSLNLHDAQVYLGLRADVGGTGDESALLDNVNTLP
jgi:hypothetical protein